MSQALQARLRLLLGSELSHVQEGALQWSLAVAR
jgi:hypothetical protein